MGRIGSKTIVGAAVWLACVPAVAADAPAPAAAPAPARQGTVQAGIGDLTRQLAGRLREGNHWPRVAVLPFEALDADARDRELGRLSAELLSSRLALEPKILQVERSRLGPIVEELRRTEQGEISPDGAASLGKLLGANAVVLGSVSGAGAEYVVTARVVDTETARVLTAADTSVPREGLVALSEDMVEVKSRGGAALRSAVLPGWGQLYNGDTGRGVAYLSLFGAAAAGALGSAYLGKQAEDDYHANTADTVGRRADANDHYDRANALLIGLGVVWAAAIADAWLTGEDARVLKPVAQEGEQ